MENKLDTFGESGFWPKRAKWTAKAIDGEFLPKSDKILDIGPHSDMTEFLDSVFQTKAHNTEARNLDEDWSWDIDKDFDVIWCFEVIEHLANPLWFLRQCAECLNDNGVMFISFPQRPKFLWNNRHHFHEIDHRRWEWLIGQAGFKIERPLHRTFVLYYKLYHFSWKYFIMGLRSPLRMLWPATNLYKLMKI